MVGLGVGGGGEGYVWWGRERLVVEGSQWVVSMWKCGGSAGL